MTPQQAAAIRDTERERLSSIVDKRIASWEKFYEDYPEVEGTLLVISELDYIRSMIYDSTNNNNRR